MPDILNGTLLQTIYLRKLFLLIMNLNLVAKWFALWTLDEV